MVQKTPFFAEMKQLDTGFTAASLPLKKKDAVMSKMKPCLSQYIYRDLVEKCLWSALLVTVVMYQSTSRATAQRGKIGSCSNWNILSCACLDADLWTHFQLTGPFLIEPYNRDRHFFPTVLSFQHSKVLNEKMRRCFLNLEMFVTSLRDVCYISKNTLWIWGTMTPKISKCCYSEHNKSNSDFWRKGGHAQPWLRFAPGASWTNAMPCERGSVNS